MASAKVSSTTSAGPPPASTSSDSATSTALPTACPSGVDMSVSSARVTKPAAAPSSTMVLGQLTGFGFGVQKGARAHLAVEHQRRGALGDLLAHHRTRDQRQRLGGAGDVAQRIDLPVRRGQLPGSEDRRSDIAELLPNLGFRQLGGEARNGFQLVECAAGVTEPPARRLRHRAPASHHDRNQRDGDLVAHPTRGVLVHQRERLSIATQICKVHPLARCHHGRRPAGDLGLCHTP